MPDIKTVTLPSGNTYDIRDEVARQAIAALQNTENVLSTNAATTPYGVKWMDGETEITGTLVASADTVKKIYLVPAKNPSAQDDNIYDEYLTLKINNEYNWEKIGSTKIDLSGLGDLAWKDSASGSYTPIGEVSQPSFTGEELTSSGSYTPSGDITIEVGSGVANYTPSGAITTPSISIATAGSTTSVGSVTNTGTLPSFSATVSNGNLIFSWESGALPSLSNVTVKTGDATYEASQPSFSGNAVQLVGEFIGASTTISVKGIPTGTVSQPSFTGQATTITVS